MVPAEPPVAKLNFLEMIYWFPVAGVSRQPQRQYHLGGVLNDARGAQRERSDGDPFGGRSSAFASAILTASAQFDRHFLYGEFGFDGGDLQTFNRVRVVKFANAPAAVTNGEHRSSLVVRMAAGHKRVQAFEAVRQSVLDQPVERPVNCWWCRKTLVLQMTDDFVGAERPADIAERIHDQLILVGRAAPLCWLAGHLNDPVGRGIRGDGSRC